jgi:hypothetical protein
VACDVLASFKGKQLEIAHLICWKFVGSGGYGGYPTMTKLPALSGSRAPLGKRIYVGFYVSSRKLTSLRHDDVNFIRPAAAEAAAKHEKIPLVNASIGSIDHTSSTHLSISQFFNLTTTCNIQLETMSISKETELGIDDGGEQEWYVFHLPTTISVSWCRQQS